ncbi:hypothetical protein CFK38_06535 [Brachybacterium vulturis]|uniref:Cupin domain-containing protein n=1 Tax=Brachybacterium vulturis TaxID=2017484 RepID=A0A291GMC8_9MICO|nr:hypothetical protein [Brachybacterium vulturis]ATG51220.1 hypothetical protein CFK38_06535 [Brachybacterium vulturis]
MSIHLDDMPVEIDQGDLQTRYLELGGMSIRYVRVPAGADMAPLLKGLPDDRCPSPHWGIVLTGALNVVHGDGSTETATAGSVYYWPPGHTATTEEPAEFIEVGPVEEMRQFYQHVRAMFSTHEEYEERS